MTNYTPLSANEVLDLVPQQAPFRFIDEISDISQEKIKGHYTFKLDEFFYPGHFPQWHVTPGVVLLECMCQIGVVALGIYLLSSEMSPEKIKSYFTLFTDAQLELFKPVNPGTKVLVTGEKIFWRRMKLKSKIEMHDEQGHLLASCIASGYGVQK